MIYEYECPQCGRFDIFKHKPEPPKAMQCACGQIAERRFSIPVVRVYGGICEVTGKRYGSASERDRLLKTQGISQKESCGSLVPKKMSFNDAQEEKDYHEHRA